VAVTLRLIINGRFLGGQRTAVNEVARALTTQLCARPGAWRVEVAVPRDLAHVAVPPDWSMRVVGRFNGILWEQCDLPKLRRDGVIAGFFNTVPLRGRGYVTLLHDAHVFSEPRSYPGATRVWRRMLSRRAGVPGNHLLTVSGHAKSRLLDYGIGTPDQIGIVPNGPGPAVDCVPNNTVPDQLNLTRAQPYCLGLASVLPHKNVSVLLAAFAKPHLRHMKLVLFGTADRSSLEGTGKAVPPNVTFTGPVSDAALAALYRSALAVCVPSTAEGFGLPALEAMAFGRPSVIAPCGALPEVVGAAGLSAPPDDPGAWADAITRLEADPALWQRLSDAALDRAACFTWERAGQAVWDHLNLWYPA
jgi:glycosyltransferase involved in cell wall biosynthesis